MIRAALQSSMPLFVVVVDDDVVDNVVVVDDVADVAVVMFSTLSFKCLPVKKMLISSKMNLRGPKSLV